MDLMTSSIASLDRGDPPQYIALKLEKFGRRQE